MLYSLPIQKPSHFTPYAVKDFRMLQACRWPYLSKGMAALVHRNTASPV